MAAKTPLHIRKLERVPGFGKGKQTALAEKFPTAEGLSAASATDIAIPDKISADLSRKIHAVLHDGLVFAGVRVLSPTPEL